MPRLMLQDGIWIVDLTEADPKATGKYRSFEAIEPAADLLMKYGVQDDSIDDAIIAIFSMKESYKLLSASFTNDGLYSELMGSGKSA
jgi:hypothetical protein